MVAMTMVIDPHVSQPLHPLPLSLSLFLFSSLPLVCMHKDQREFLFLSTEPALHFAIANRKLFFDMHEYVPREYLLSFFFTIAFDKQTYLCLVNFSWGDTGLHRDPLRTLTQFNLFTQYRHEWFIIEILGCINGIVGNKRQKGCRN